MTERIVRAHRALHLQFVPLVRGTVAFVEFTVTGEVEGDFICSMELCAADVKIIQEAFAVATKRANCDRREVADG